jgi:hypothetical protein
VRKSLIIARGGLKYQRCVGTITNNTDGHFFLDILSKVRTTADLQSYNQMGMCEIIIESCDGFLEKNIFSCAHVVKRIGNFLPKVELCEV